MGKYLKKLDEYIELKIQYEKIEKTPMQEIELRNARAEMEVALLLLIRNNH